MPSQSRDEAESELALVVEQTTRTFLQRVLDEVTTAIREGRSGDAQPVLALGVLLGWWTDAVGERVVASIRESWQAAFSVTSGGAPHVSARADAMAFHLTAVRDRLSRSAKPEIPEAAFEQVRLSQSAAALGGWSTKDQARDIAERLAWEPDKGYWKQQKAYAEARIDEVLDPLGKPGSPARQWAHEHDPAVKVWQGVRAAAVDKIREDESDWKVRATRIARTESTAAWNSGALAALAAEGRTHKKWLASKDARTRDSHREADGQVVPIGRPFRVGESLLAMPGDPAAPPWEVIGCRCTVVGADAPTTLIAGGKMPLVGTKGREMASLPRGSAVWRVAVSMGFAIADQSWVDQLRIPRGNGKQSGRWTYTPWMHLDDLTAAFDASDVSVPDDARAYLDAANAAMGMVDRESFDVRDEDMQRAVEQAAEALQGTVDALPSGPLRARAVEAQQAVQDFAETDWSLLEEASDIGRNDETAGGDGAPRKVALWQWTDPLPSDAPINDPRTSKELADRLDEIKAHHTAPSPKMRKDRAAAMQELNDRRARDNGTEPLQKQDDVDWTKKGLGDSPAEGLPTDWVEGPDGTFFSPDGEQRVQKSTENGLWYPLEVGAISGELKHAVTLKKPDFTDPGSGYATPGEAHAAGFGEPVIITPVEPTLDAKTGIVSVAGPDGRKHDLGRVWKSQEGNPSARGGAYRDVWRAEFHSSEGTKYPTKINGTFETRKAAVDALLSSPLTQSKLNRRGLVLKDAKVPEGHQHQDFIDAAIKNNTAYDVVRDGQVQPGGPWKVVEGRRNGYIRVVGADGVGVDVEVSELQARAEPIPEEFSEQLRFLADSETWDERQDALRSFYRWAINGRSRNTPGAPSNKAIDALANLYANGVVSRGANWSELGADFVNAVVDEADTISEQWKALVRVLLALPQIEGAGPSAAEGDLKDRYGVLDSARTEREAVIRDVGAFYAVRTTNNNCVLASTAYELRRRGLNVLPKQASKGRNSSASQRAWFQVDGIHETMVDGLKGTRAKARHRIISEHVAARHEPGQRGTIRAGWKGRNFGHIWNWEVLDDGEVQFLDAQTGQIIGGDREDYWGEMDYRFVTIARLDHLPLRADVEVTLAPKKDVDRLTDDLLETAKALQEAKVSRDALLHEVNDLINRLFRAPRGPARDEVEARYQARQTEFRAVEAAYKALKETPEAQRLKEIGNAFPFLDPNTYKI
jgi:hypothetical protein